MPTPSDQTPTVETIGSSADARSSGPAHSSARRSPRPRPAWSALVRAPDEDVLLRMQRDLKKAMAKPVEERSWVMVIDTRKCVGCHACTIACVAENKLPPGVVYRPVVTRRSSASTRTSSCASRLVPACSATSRPCVPVCPVNGHLEAPDGIVAIDYDKCIGCRYCLTACPYGARTSDFGESYVAGAPRGPTTPRTVVFGPQAPWMEQPSHEYGKPGPRGPPVARGQRAQVPLLPAPAGGRPAARVRDLVHRPGDLLRRRERPGQPGHRADHAEQRADAAAAHGHQGRGSSTSCEETDDDHESNRPSIRSERRHARASAFVPWREALWGVFAVSLVLGTVGVAMRIVGGTCRRATARTSRGDCGSRSTSTAWASPPVPSRCRPLGYLFGSRASDATRSLRIASVLVVASGGAGAAGGGLDSRSDGTRLADPRDPVVHEHDGVQLVDLLALLAVCGLVWWLSYRPDRAGSDPCWCWACC
jgi:Fe-S-cluster-containing hydrogenase component 2